MNFIEEYFLEDITLCDKLIDYFENSEEKHPGITGHQRVIKEIKDSTDVTIFPENFSDIREYFNQLDICVQKYIEKYPACNAYSPWAISECAVMKRYYPGQGYHAWHCERSGEMNPVCNRHLVFMTYLNDVTNGGGTEFLLQNKTFTSVKGKTLIWPADWTHTHRGVVSETQTKYIISGWFNYLPLELSQG